MTEFNVETKVETLAIHFFLSARNENTTFCQRAKHADAPDSAYFDYKLGILSRQARLNGATEKIVVLLLRLRILERERNSTSFGLYGKREMYTSQILFQN